MNAPCASIGRALCVAFCLPLSAHADDPCSDAAAAVPKILAGRYSVGTEVLGLGDEVRTIQRIRHPEGDVLLLQWSYGATGAIECTFIAHRQGLGSFQKFDVSSNWGFVRLDDIDHDGWDELVVLEGPKFQWGNCSDYSNVPRRLRIGAVDLTSGSIKDVTRSHGPFIRTYLPRLKEKRDFQMQQSGVLTAECEKQWNEIFTEAFTSAWYSLKLAAAAVGFGVAALGAAHVRSLRWLARLAGLAMTLAVFAAAFYSFGAYGWHVVPFNEFWSAAEFVLSLSFHSAPLEWATLFVMAYAGWKLMTS